MNADRRIQVQLLANITKVYSGKGMPQRILMIVRDAVKALAETERRSVQKMEKFKDNENTAKNYRNAVACMEDLSEALELLEEGDLDDAYALLKRVAEPEAAAAEAPKAKATSARKAIRNTRQKDY